MREFFPVFVGALLGGAQGWTTNRHVLIWGSLVAVVVGVLATIFSGEYKIGWEFLLIDIPVAALAAVGGYVGVQALRRPAAGQTALER